MVTSSIFSGGSDKNDFLPGRVALGQAGNQPAQVAASGNNLPARKTALVAEWWSLPLPWSAAV
jgi:hypothetical protein